MRYSPEIPQITRVAAMRCRPCCPFVLADSAPLYLLILSVCTCLLVLSGPSAGQPVVWDNNQVNRDQPDITDLGNDVFQIDTRMAGYQGITAGYLIRGSRPCLVETGTSTSAPIVARALAALGVGADDLASVVVTHIHLDHAGGVGDIAVAYPKAEIVVHQRGARHLADPRPLMASAEMAYGDALDRLFGRLAPVPADRIRALDDTGVVDLGDGRRLDSHYSPGHAKHHVGLIDSDSGDLYVGDAAGVYFPDTGDLRPATPPADFDLDAALESLARFRALRPTRLLFSHYGPVPNAPEILDRSAEEITVWVEGTRQARRLGLDLDHAVAMVREQTLARYNAYADGADPAVAEKIEVISGAEVNVEGIWHWLGKMAAVPERADLAELAELPPYGSLTSPGARCGRPAS
jgi:glyoxylase-like metal-dependent hydrolase (beta-lactamase superfamily II)